MSLEILFFRALLCTRDNHLCSPLDNFFVRQNQRVAQATDITQLVTLHAVTLAQKAVVKSSPAPSLIPQTVLPIKIYQPNLCFEYVLKT